MSGTTDRLLTATIDLLVEKGARSTTLRDITERAQVNVAAVGYHYGSKDALVGQAFRAILEEVTGLQRRRLEALSDEATLEDLVRTWLSPALVAAGSGEREGLLWRAIASAMSEGEPALLEQTASLAGDVEKHLLQRLAAHLPHLSAVELAFRHTAVLGSLSALGGGLGHLLPDVPGSDVADMTVAWVVGALRAAPALPD